jgi:hypothetical protein
MFRVFKQFEPTPTDQPFSIHLPNGGTLQGVWYSANLVQIGTVNSWEEAKQLTCAPIVEEIK